MFADFQGAIIPWNFQTVRVKFFHLDQSRRDTVWDPDSRWLYFAPEKAALLYQALGFLQTAFSRPRSIVSILAHMCGLQAIAFRLEIYLFLPPAADNLSENSRALFGHSLVRIDSFLDPTRLNSS